MAINLLMSLANSALIEEVSGAGMRHIGGMDSQAFNLVRTLAARQPSILDKKQNFNNF
jgi:hypothetical protein